jgi:hypothetical protein
MEFSEVDFNDHDSFYSCVSVLSTIPAEETVMGEEFFECSSLNHHHVHDTQLDKPPCSVLYKVSFTENTPCPVFCAFKIPLFYVIQRNLSRLTCPSNPAKTLPTVERKTEPVQDSIPRVKMKPTPNA